MASMQPKSEGAMPNCGIRALVSVRGSAEERSSLRVFAGPLALDRLRARLRSATGTRSAEREVRSTRSASACARWASVRRTGLATAAEAGQARGEAGEDGRELGAVAQRTALRGRASVRGPMMGVVLCGQDVVTQRLTTGQSVTLQRRRGNAGRERSGKKVHPNTEARVLANCSTTGVSPFTEVSVTP